MSMQPPAEDRTVAVSERSFIRLVRTVGRQERQLKALRDDVKKLTSDENLQSLVKHAPEVLAQMTPSPEIAALAEYVKAHITEITTFIETAPAFVAQMRQQQSDRAVFFRILRRYLRFITIPVRKLSTLLIALASGAVAVIVDHILSRPAHH